MKALVSVGPVGVAVAAYGLLLDHVADSLFTEPAIRYLFCAVCAVLLGMVTFLVGNWLLGSQRPAVTGAEAPSEPAIEAILRGTRERLLQDIRSVDDGGKCYHGWSQYFGDPERPTAIGTSFGLRLANALRVYDSRVDRAQLLDTIMRLQKPGGGWAASSQRDVARPEVTAWVLVAATRSGLDLASKQLLVKTLEASLDPVSDRIGLSSTSVVSNAVSALAELAPSSQKLDELVETLLAGVQLDEQRDTNAWGATLSPRSRRSVALTARAVVALTRVVAARQRTTEISEAVERGVRWLCSPGDLATFSNRLANTEDQIRRPMPGGRTDLLIVGNFTSAWVARALLAAGGPEHEPYLRAAISLVCQHQQKGVWMWEDSEPVWMTYQGATALLEYSLRCYTWPP